MAQLIGGLGTSHIPAIGNAIHKGLQNEPYWKPFFDGFPPIRQWLGEKQPDVVVMFYNDHGLNFFLDKMPTFAVGAAAQYNNADEGWGIPTLPPFPGEVDLSWHLINTLIDQEFDVTTCQEMLVDHACTLPLKLFWPEGDCPVAVVPVCINTVQFPLPSAKRCYALGKAVGQAIQSWDSNKKVAVIASGGLSHQLDGERAGFYTAAEDGTGCPKDLILTRTAAGVEFSWHRPCFATGADVQAYDVVTAAFGGSDGEPADWRDAADLYKAWALTQPWCASPTIRASASPS